MSTKDGVAEMKRGSKQVRHDERKRRGSDRDGDTGISLPRSKSPSSIDGLLRQSNLRGHRLTRDQVAELRHLALLEGRWEREDLEALTEELAR